MRKICFLWAMCLLLSVAGCGKDDAGLDLNKGGQTGQTDGDKDKDKDKNDGDDKPGKPDDTPSINDESGLYLGVIAFNQNLTKKNISLLNTDTRDDFNGFIDDLTSEPGTLLYYAVDNAIDMLEAASLPDDIINASLITFTDGLDQGSMMMNPTYPTETEYLNAIHEHIQNDRVQDNPISAYTIGLKGTDVTNETLFQANLDKLASSPENAVTVSNMSEMNDNFQKIAEQLYRSRTTQTLSLKIPGPGDGTKVRFTFDNAAAASRSKLYIEGTFSLQDYSLRDVVYEGFEPGESVVAGEANGIFVTFDFKDLRDITTGELVASDKVKQWNLSEGADEWQMNSEFTPENNTETIIERKSAVIVLILDCSSSLGNDFNHLKTNAKDFINKMALSSND